MHNIFNIRSLYVIDNCVDVIINDICTILPRWGHFRADDWLCKSNVQGRTIGVRSARYSNEKSAEEIHL
jgi:hypothetical protein